MTSCDSWAPGRPCHLQLEIRKRVRRAAEYNYGSLQKTKVTFRVVLTANDHDAHDEKYCCNGQSSIAQGHVIWTQKTRVKHSTTDTISQSTLFCCGDTRAQIKGQLQHWG